MHVGIILDGNRRYAKKLGIKAWEGHTRGSEAGQKLIQEWAPQLGITELTLYVFSMQNFQRSKQEVEFLMNLFRKWFTALDREELAQKGIRINFIGRTHLLPEDIQTIIRDISEQTKNHATLTVNFAMAYGGREELVDGVRAIAEQVSAEKLQPNDITEDTITKSLYLQSQPDLVIRTGGAMRSSNFLLWQTWYSEWFFVDKFWPEFSKDDLQNILDEFAQRERRFGK